VSRPPDPRLLAAKARLDTLDWYPAPVRVDGVYLLVSRAVFELPWLRRFDGWATHRAIFVRRPELLDDADLVCHELCHVWQMQHRPIGMPLSYAWSYARNPYELQARRAAAVTRSSRSASP
jgi:hypothetical protein